VNVAPTGLDILTQGPEYLQEHADDFVALKDLLQQPDVVLKTVEGLGGVLPMG
jgi:hypothetical protein